MHNSFILQQYVCYITILNMYRRLGGPPGPVWTGAGNLASTGIRSSDHTAVASRYTG